MPLKCLFVPVLATCLLVFTIACNRNSTDPPVDFILEADKLSVNLQDSVSSTDTIRITSNTAWTVEVPQDPTWLQVAPLSGNGDGAIVIRTTAKNADSLSRSANIQVKTKLGNKSIFIAVTQLKSRGSFLKAVFGGSKDDVLNDVVATADGNFIAVGTSVSRDGDLSNFGFGRTVWVMKFDKEGNKLWNKVYGGTGYDIGVSIVSTASDNYIVSTQGTSIDGDVSNYLGAYDAWLFSIDNDGNLLWEKSMGGSGIDMFYNMEATSDGNFLLAGYTNSNNHDIALNHGAYDAWLAKIDDNGTVIWQKTFGGAGDDKIFDAKQVTDGGYILSGITESNDGDVSDRQDTGKRAWFVKLDADRKIVWSKYLEIQNANGYRVGELSNGDYIFGGNTNLPASADNFHNGTDAFICRVNSAGEFTWKKSFGGADEDWLYDVIVTTDDRLLIAGYSKSADGDIQQNAGGSDAFFIMLDAEGNMVSSKTFGGPGDDDAFRLIEINPNQFAFVGNTYYPTNFPELPLDRNAWFGIVGY